MRFPDKEAHQVFLEPEGLDVDEIYTRLVVGSVRCV